MAPKRRRDEGSKLDGEIIKASADVGDRRVTRSLTTKPRDDEPKPTAGSGADADADAPQPSNPLPRTRTRTRTPTNIFLEFCTSDNKFNKKAQALRRSIVAAALNVNFVMNPAAAGNSRAGCFEVRTEEKGGHIIFSRLNMKSPYSELDGIKVGQLVGEIDEYLKMKAKD